MVKKYKLVLTHRGGRVYAHGKRKGKTATVSTWGTGTKKYLQARKRNILKNRRGVKSAKIVLVKKRRKLRSRGFDLFSGGSF